MRPLLVSKPLIGLVLILLIAQVACAGSSISPSPTPPTLMPVTGGTNAAPGTQPAGTPTMSVGQNGSPADARTMLRAAIKHYHDVGRDQALKDFTDKKPPFDSGGLFVVCLGSDHRITAFGGLPMLVGISADTITVTGGQGLGQLLWDAVSVQPQGSIPFQWKNPLTGQQESRMLFYQKLDQDVCGVPAKNP